MQFYHIVTAELMSQNTHIRHIHCFYWIGNHTESNVKSLCGSVVTWKLSSRPTP